MTTRRPMGLHRRPARPIAELERHMLSSTTPKSITVGALKQIVTGVPMWSTGRASFASPNSGLFDGPTSAGRSGADRARALVREKLHTLDRVRQPIAIELHPLVVVSSARTRRTPGNWPSIIREINRRPAMSKNKWRCSRRVVLDIRPLLGKGRSSMHVFLGRMTRTSSSVLGLLGFPRVSRTVTSAADDVSSRRHQAHRIALQDEQRRYSATSACPPR